MYLLTQVRLYRDDEPDAPTHTITMATTTFFYLPSLPMDDQVSYPHILRITVSGSIKLIPVLCSAQMVA
jgi:hypothetical protein